MNMKGVGMKVRDRILRDIKNMIKSNAEGIVFFTNPKDIEDSITHKYTILEYARLDEIPEGHYIYYKLEYGYMDFIMDEDEYTIPNYNKALSWIVAERSTGGLTEALNILKDNNLTDKERIDKVGNMICEIAFDLQGIHHAYLDDYRDEAEKLKRKWGRENAQYWRKSI